MDVPWIFDTTNRATVWEFIDKFEKIISNGFRKKILLSEAECVTQFGSNSSEFINLFNLLTETIVWKTKARKGKNKIGIKSRRWIQNSKLKKSQN